MYRKWITSTIFYFYTDFIVLLGLSSLNYIKMGYKGWEAFVPFFHYIIQKEVQENQNGGLSWLICQL